MMAPDLHRWQQMLLQSNCVGDGCPLVLDGSRLYLSRYWHYENAITGALLSRSATTPAPGIAESDKEQQPVSTDACTDPLAQLLRLLFAISGADLSEQTIAELRRKQRWQEVAVAMALQRRFSVICGGPGTGKTTTVTKLLALLLQQAALDTPDRKLKIRLAAPTGKAAARLTQSIRDALQGERGLRRQPALADYQALLEEIPEEATTLHRLLGVQRHSSEFRHNRQNPLRCDVLVVDEASMVDLPMMAKTIAALPASARLILLGDKDQLASVEAGSVLADMYRGLDIARAPVTMRYSAAMRRQIEILTGHNLAQHQDPDVGTFGDNLCLLQESFRFQGGIGALAVAVNQGQADRMLQLLAQADLTDICLNPVNDASRETLLKLAQQGYGAYLKLLQPPQQVDPAQVLKAFEQFRVLCALRRGDFGVEGLNKAIEQRLQRAGLIRSGAEFYAGRPIMITENSYELQLFNGDIGILLQDPQKPGELRANFLMPDNRIKAFVPTQLPAHDTAYAMTVHKSQGSEFAHTCLVLPERVEAQGKGILTRELVYTGLTRAKQQLDIFANEPMLRMAIGQQTQRASGLGEKLWGGA
jgi:exodeoxyribonuclease V alpha subunit